MTASRLAQVIQASTSQVLAALADCVEKTLLQMGPQALGAHSNLQRQVLHRAERELQFKKNGLLASFGRLYREEVSSYLGEQAPAASVLAKETDWTALSLVDDAEVERGVQADRLAQQLAAGNESALERVSASLADLHAPGELVQHPLRPRVLAEALLTAVSELDSDDDVAQALNQQLARVLGELFGPLMERILEDWRAMGLQPKAPAYLRRGGPPGASAPASLHSAQGTLSGPASSAASPTNWAPQAETALRQPGHAQARATAQDPHAAAAMQADAQWHAAQALSQMFGMGLPAGLAPPGSAPAFSATGLMPPGAPMPPAAGWSSAAHSGRGQSAALARADFQELIHQIALASPASEWQAMQAMQGAELGGDAAAAWPPEAAWSGTPQAGASVGGLAGPMMAVNVIRSHRDELIRASGGAPIDQMVIDIVAALFDQVLSDPKVMPQMARQIARLQMPVLRVALADMGFFNSRKHPVRRFVNRIASLSAAFDDASSASGQACLSQVTSLVDDVVEGDFEQIELFEGKLAELEAFVDAENQREAQEHAQVAELLQRKEADLKVQQRFRQVLQKELHDLEMPEFLRSFLLDVWTQVQVMVAARDGADSPHVDRMRRVAHELVVSVQPKGNPELRKAFLQTLPGLMKTLNEGLALIQWPEEAKQAFFGQLLPTHAECLKAAPTHELTRRMLEQRLLKVDRLAIPSREEAANDPLPNALIDIDKPPVLTVVSALSAAEIKDAGFVPEAAVVTDEPLDIDLDLSESATGAEGDVDINLDAPPPPSQGLGLIHHIQNGTAYNMQMQGQWKKVRLTWISEGRNFFIFTHGHTHKQTISLTARTLAKMCDSGRFRAFEQAELIERATLRARRQLAALTAATKDRSAA
ncbi:MAG: hypothetical protein RI907_1694 [Pseudomonadota bacterium]